MSRFGIVLAAVVFVFNTSAQANEDLNKMFAKVNEYVTAQNFPKALEELGWVKKEIEKKHNNKLSSFFPDQIQGFTGQKVNISGAMGFSSVERNYRKDGESFSVSLSGGSGAGMGAMGGLAAFAKMGAMMGAQQSGQETMRIDGRTATLEETGSGQKVQVFLNSGSIFTIDLRGKDNDTTKVKTMVEAFEIAKLDSYLQGQS